jgi:glycosyltransferase involved in cell wall biosynthesis
MPGNINKQKNQLDLTVVTVVYNDKKNLEKTIKSIKKLKELNNFEYIIIDGGSSDGTIEIIKSHEEIDKLISENDNGIYHAMNKGLDLASGKWINFMNAGDELISIPELAENDIYGLIYGRAVIDFNKVLKVKKNIELADFDEGMIICHQACFYRREIIAGWGYDEKYKICADQKLTASILKNHQALFVDQVITKYDTGGISSKNNLKILKEKININKELDLPTWPAYKSLIRTLIVNARDKIYKLIK